MKIGEMTPEELAQAVAVAEKLPPELFRKLADSFRWAANQAEAAYAAKDPKERLALLLEIGEHMEKMNGALAGGPGA